MQMGIENVNSINMPPLWRLQRHEALCKRGGPGSLEASLEMSRDYDVTENMKVKIMHQNTETEMQKDVVNIKNTLCYGVDWLIAFEFKYIKS